MSQYYPIYLALHIISIICWMAGILYLYRLFVYHAAESESVVKERLGTMELRLYTYITMPAMVSSIFFGAIMVVANPMLLKMPWMHTKLLFVFFLIGATHMAGMYGRQLRQGESKKSAKFFRLMNEVPTLLMIGIVFLVILKPF